MTTRRKILIVDDSTINRQILGNILADDYDLLEAADGRTALDVLRGAGDKISAVLLDIVMPVMDGFEVLKQMRGDSRLSSVPVIVATGKVDSGSEAESLSLGANDFVTKPYDPAVIKHRLGNAIKLFETVSSLNAAIKDDLTGLYNRKGFFDKAAELIAARDPGYYVMSCFDVDNFKVVNDQYGSEKGDRLLKFIAETFTRGFGPVGGLCCRIMADNFAVLYPRYFMDDEGLAAIRRTAALFDGSMPAVSFSIGRYIIDDKSLPISAMYDRASIARSSIKGRFDIKIALYDESMRERILRGQQIVSEMKGALENGQFEAWFQPQYNHATGALIGAEALARWRHPTRGLVSPAEFIPVFERNGFIYELDKYIWERACVFLRGWLDAGLSPLPVSVNISRYDAFRDDLTDVLTGMIEKYRIPVDLLRLEITESAFAKSTVQLISVVKRLVDYGFIVEIDDFGSGYSSFNTLKDVPANVLKLDMRFLENNENSSRGGNILESIVRMTKWLGLSVIAEGVETRAQADYLKSIGCNYVQGYLYAKPMPEEEYLALAAKADKGMAMPALKTVETLDNNAFWNPQSMETLIFNSYIGGACVFEYTNGHIELLRANDKYVRTIGGGSLTVKDALSIEWSRLIDKADLPRMRKALRRAIDTGEEVVCEAAFLGLTREHEKTYLRASMRVIARAGRRYLFYCMFENLTLQREAEQKERATAERMNMIMQNVNGGITAAIVVDDKPRILFANDQFYMQLGYTKEQFAAEVPSAFELIHPEDRKRVKALTIKASLTREPTSCVYRAMRRDGGITWLQENISIASFPGVSEPVQLAVSNDITAQIESERRIVKSAEQLRFLNDTARDLLAPGECGVGIERVLRKVLDYFGGSRAYVIELNYERKVSNNTYEVCAAGVRSEAENLRGVPFADSPFWIRDFGKDDYISIEDVDSLDESRGEEKRLLQEQGVRSLVAVPLRRDGKLVGFIGVDDPGRQQSHIDQLKAIGDYMAVILTRRDLTAKIENDNEALISLMNDTPGGFVRMRLRPDGVTVPVYVNAGFCDLVGMTYGEIMDKYGKDAMWGVHPDDTGVVEEAVARMFATGEARNLKYRLLHGNGEYIWLMIFGRMTKDEAGETFFNVYYTDVSEQEKTELSFREMLPVALAAVMESSTDLLFVKDKNLSYVCCSRAFAEMAGLKDGREIAGKTDYDLFDRELAEQYRADDRRLMEGGRSLVDYVERIPSADGGARYSSTSKYLLRDSSGVVVGIYGAGRDVTESRAAYAQLKLLTDNIPGGLSTYEVSSGGVRALYLSGGVYSLTGYAREEYDELTGGDPLRFVFEEDRPALLAQIEELREHGSPLDCLYRIHVKDGGFRWVNIRGALSDRRGGEAVVHAVMFDVTKRKAAEEAARLHEAEAKRARTQIDRMSRMHSAFDTLFANTRDIMYIVDDQMIFRGASAGFAELIGLSGPDEVVGRKVDDVIKNEAIARKHIRDDKTILKSGGNMTNFMETAYDAAGKLRYQLCSKYAIPGADGLPDAVLCVSRDISGEYERMEDYMSEVQYLLQSNSDAFGAWLFDLTAWRVVDVRVPENAAVAIPRLDTIDGYLEAAKETARDNEAVQDFLRDFSPETMLALYKSGRRRTDFEYRRLAADGSDRWVRLSVFLLLAPMTGHLMAVAALNDITEARTAHYELIRAAEVDSMTGVLNHDALQRQIERFLAGEGAGGLHALLMVDRDNLKQVNDTLGHQAGDEIIVETAKALQRVFRDTDIVGRVGGDEFIVLMKNIDRPRTARKKAAELLQSLQYICGAAGSSVESTASIGISLYDGGGKTLDKLYAEADTAMYMAKAGGRNRFVMADAGEDSDDSLSDERERLMDTVNLRTLLNSIDGGVLILHMEPDKELRPVFFSDSFLTMMGGLTHDEAFALYGGGLLEHIHPDDRERVRAEYSAALAGGKPLRTSYRLLGKNGAYRWLSVGTNITKRADGGVDVYAVHTNIEKLMLGKEKLASDELRFRVAFSQTSRMLYEADVAADTLSIYASDGKRHGAESHIAGLPDSAVESGFIHEKSAAAFRKFYCDMKAGKQEDKGLFQCRYFSTGQYGWAAMSYQMVFDGEGRPRKAIGSIEELPHIARAQERFDREEQLMTAVRDDALATLKVNLSKDAIKYIHAEEGGGFLCAATESYAVFAEALSGALPYPEDVLLWQLNLLRGRLLEAYAAGKCWISLEYRRADGGEIRWTKASACLIEDPVSRELYMFLYICDVEKRRGIETPLPATAERDPVNYIYSQSAAEKLIDLLLRGGGVVGRRCSLAVIRMEGLPEMAARVGAENVDLEKMYLSRSLSIQLDGDCLVGHYNDNGVLVFCPDAESSEWMEKKIARAVARAGLVRNAAGPDEGIRLICGISTENAGSADLSGMLAQASRVCDACRGTGGDVVRSFEQYVNSFRATADKAGKSAFISVAPEELSRPLFASEREAMNGCMSVMLSADRYDLSVAGVLGVLGEYYGAQRVYTLSLVASGTAVSGLHEWVAAGWHSTLDKITGMSLKKLPMFKRVLAMAKPVILDGVTRGGESPWSFIVLPVIAGGKVQGFLCIENPEKHKADVALPNALIPMLMHERARFSLGADGLKIAGRDELTGLPDRSSFDSAARAFAPGERRSAGVLYVTLAPPRGRGGADAARGGEMLVFAAQALANIVKKARIYRISARELAAVCENVSQEVFTALCRRCQSVLQRRHPKCFYCGGAWSDSDLSVKKLLNEAERSAGGSDKAPWPAGAAGEDRGNLLDIKEGLAAGRFFIRLQPLVDMRTGKAVGAEALARCRDAAGTEVLPGAFLHAFETLGITRELDYFVLDQAFRTVEEWRARGLAPLPISVNFSRRTLLSGTALASALAVSSRYDLPDGLVKIEVPASIGGGDDPEPVRRALAEMGEQGFRFVLDDLGLEYLRTQTFGGLPVDEAKLGRSLIGSFLFNSLNRSVVESLVGVCAKNGVRCVAKGVESEPQAEGLREAGCVFAQGYYYGRPLTVEDFCKKYLQ
ncbi:MAG: EAL domain-containing protein [bacterium]|nr:EAL domain-containing protein [bacterium]